MDLRLIVTIVIFLVGFLSSVGLTIYKAGKLMEKFEQVRTEMDKIGHRTDQVELENKKVDVALERLNTKMTNVEVLLTEMRSFFFKGGISH